MPVWEVVVHSPDGSPRRVLTPEDPVDEIRWALRGDGDCLEASIVGRGLDLRPREILSIRAVDHAASASAPFVRYWGWVVESAGSRGPLLSETRLVGGSKRLQEVANTLGRMPPYLDTDTWDVGLSARDVIRLPTMPALIEGNLGAYAPVQGFEHGVRSPHLETVAETLDALAAMVPGFTVLSGSSYNYNGVTYTAGQVVPPTTWGVRASHDGIDATAYAFLRRWDGLAVIDELEDSAVVTWQPVSAEVVVDRVRVVLFDVPLDGTTETRLGLTGAPYVPVGRLVVAAGSQYGAEKVVTLPALEGLIASVDWAGPTAANSGLVNVNNAFTTNLATYASDSALVGRIQLRRNAASSTVAVRLTYSSAVPVSLRLSWRNPSGPMVTYEATFDATDGVQRQAVLTCPRVEGGFTDYLEVEVYADGLTLVSGDAIRIYELIPMKVNVASMQRFGEAHLRLPAEFSGEVTVPGKILQPQSRVQVTLADSSVVTAKGEAWEYSISRDSGLSTTVRLNQALPAAEGSEAAALTSRLERLVLRGRRA